MMANQLAEDQDAQIQSVYKSVERLAGGINPPSHPWLTLHFRAADIAAAI